MEAISAQAWLERFSRELAKHVQDEGVRPADIATCAGEAMEDRRYSLLGPEDAAKLWARDFA